MTKKEAPDQSDTSEMGECSLDDLTNAYQQGYQAGIRTIFNLPPYQHKRLAAAWLAGFDDGLHQYELSISAA
ncbi:ribosome modulation factor [Endozoicomonas sp. SM1973]|uniref:Ribosome modulation factor n=1 Tax=Spartinivicinus marinus TaxID=2994442 RepID=A0A853IGI3_9GAMM|nr:ribosome modulation factor [Spartinivicinus marinus]MCX4027108.1 hypothetical protein [Spartinivicinus marinus]NYZ68587.1 ribosome modulation factor [Spartinivicinus marinus]